MSSDRLHQHPMAGKPGQALSGPAQAPSVSIQDIKTSIERAFQRNAALEARRITVEVEDGKITLRGKVHAAFERDEATRATWATPGVTHVETSIVLEQPLQASIID